MNEAISLVSSKSGGGGYKNLTFMLSVKKCMFWSFRIEESWQELESSEEVSVKPG